MHVGMAARSHHYAEDSLCIDIRRRTSLLHDLRRRRSLLHDLPRRRSLLHDLRRRRSLIGAQGSSAARTLGLGSPNVDETLKGFHAWRTLSGLMVFLN